MTAILTALSAEPFTGPGVGITDTCGLCHQRFDLMSDPAQYPTITTMPGDPAELICDGCQDGIDAEMSEPERSGWYCPECEAETRHILCDGCKVLICEICGYPCECGDREADYAEAKAENDFAADLTDFREA